MCGQKVLDKLPNTYSDVTFGQLFEKYIKLDDPMKNGSCRIYGYGKY